MPGQIERGVDLGNRHVLGSIGDFEDFVASVDFAFLENPEIETWPVMRNQQRRHLRLVHSDADPVTGHPWLGHFEQRTADSIPVAGAHLVVR